MKRRTFLGAAGALGAYGALRVHGDPPARPPAKRLVVVFVTGGWDTAYALDPRDPMYADPRPGAPRMFEGLDVVVDESRPSVTAFFDKYAGTSSIVRGIATEAVNHNECQRRIATGTREDTKPDFAAIVAHDLGNDLPLPYLILGDTAWTGPYAVSSGRVGTTNQLVELLDPASIASAPTSRGDGISPRRPGLTPAEEELLRTYAAASANRARAGRGATGYNRRRVDDFVEAIDRAKRLRGIRAGLGPRGRTMGFDAQIDVALDALAQDLSHSVTISTGLAWDTHSENFLQNSFHDTLFAGLTRLVDGLAARPGRASGTTMLDDTLVAVISEMSRTLRLGDVTDPNTGSNHWPITSALLVGSGIPAGRVIGGVDPQGGPLAVNLATGAADPNGTSIFFSNFVAGVLALCGVDAASHLDATELDAILA